MCIRGDREVAGSRVRAVLIDWTVVTGPHKELDPAHLLCMPNVAQPDTAETLLQMH